MMKQQNIIVIDYGMGNLWSVVSALEYLGFKPKICSDPNEIRQASSLILPGVGSFRNAMIALGQNGLDQAIIEAVQKKGINILGICLGMQLMCTRSTEGGDTFGLGLIECFVDRFKSPEIEFNKIPHIGFDQVQSHPESKLFKGLRQASDFYFLHSYRILPSGLDGIPSICNYGIDFLAAYEKNNIYASQFHPEKSQANGLMFLKNFLKLSEC